MGHMGHIGIGCMHFTKQVAHVGNVHNRRWIKYHPKSPVVKILVLTFVALKSGYSLSAIIVIEFNMWLMVI